MNYQDLQEAPAYENPFRRALANGRPLVGLWAMLNSTSAIEGLGWTGFDWILIDGEHSPVTITDAVAHLRGIAATPAIPILRVAANDRVLLKQHLDIGALTIMVPYVQTPEEAAEAVRSIRYPKQGVRGFAAMHRASRYGHLKDYVHNADRGLYLIVQVETEEALGNTSEIAAVAGVDSVFFGPGDLSASLGLLGQPGHPDITDRIVSALQIVKAQGKTAGVLAPNAELAEYYLGAGFDYVSVGSDCSILFGTARTLAKRYATILEGGGAVDSRTTRDVSSL